MPVSRRGAATTIAAAIVLLAGSTLGSYAANGGPLLLGKGNTASKTTKLKTTGNGAALSLKSKSGKAPLKVSNSTKVTNLNADLVDGQDAAALQNKAFVYELTAIGVNTSFVSFALPGLPSGRYHASLSASADITGSPTLFGCFVLSGTMPNVDVPVVGAGIDGGGGNQWFTSAGGFVDTTTATYRVACQESGGTSMTIPALSQYPARVVFTRLDDVTKTGSTGVGSATPRGLAPLR